MDELTIYYPSGQTAMVSGEALGWFMAGTDPVFVLRLERAQQIFGRYMEAGTDLVIDPRAVIVRDGATILTPRSTPPPPAIDWVREWLDEHPEWPAVLELEAVR